jgi:FkbM family methyltransferase
MQLHPDDAMHRQISATGFYELSLSRAIARIARDEGGLLVDVGANYGYFSLLWTASRDGNRVVAFEPEPAVAAALRGNVALNGFEKRIEVVEAAASRMPGSVRFRRSLADGQTGHGMVATAEVAKESDDERVYEEVRATTLDSEVTQIPTVLKLDVQGAEAWVLEGARKLLATRKVAHVFYEDVEVLARFYEPLGTCARILEGCGYTIEEFGENEYHAWFKS